MIRWSDVTAVFGGTFDPPHLGHRIAARELLQNPGVKCVLVIPSADPPLKSAKVPLQHRVRMVELNFASVPGDPMPSELEIDLREIQRNLKSSGRPSYTFDTLQELSSEIPALAFVTGIEQLEQMHRWHRFPEVLGHSHWLVLGRKPDGIERAQKLMQLWKSQGLAESTRDPETYAVGDGRRYLRLVPTSAPEISSTRIREAISRTGSAPKGSLLGTVEAYLKENSLYGTENRNEPKTQT